jgi:hypothetical protein
MIDNQKRLLNTPKMITSAIPEGYAYVQSHYRKIKPEAEALPKMDYSGDTMEQTQRMPNTLTEEQMQQMTQQMQYPQTVQTRQPMRAVNVAKEDGYNPYTAQMQGVTQEQLMMDPEMQYAMQEEQLKAQQYEIQKRDNIMFAPNVLKGELKDTGAGLLTTDKKTSILSAPNFMHGQMRIMDGQQEMPAVTLSEKPQSNQLGQEYVEIDPIGGKEVLKRRPSEKWLDGRAY